MGQAPRVTVPAMQEFQQFRQDVVDGIDRGEITPFWAGRLQLRLVRLCDRLAFADARVALASTVLRDGRDIEHLHDRCHAARISPAIVAIGPELSPLGPEAA